MNERPLHFYRYRSLFWPIALIGVGLVWLLSNLGVIGPLSIYGLLQLWPLLLIALGLDIILGRRWPFMGAVIGLLTVAAALAILIAAPSLGFNGVPQLKTGHFSEPVGTATQAQVELSLSAGRTTVNPLGDSNALIDANLNYTGEIDFSASGDQLKTVSLRQRNLSGFLLWPYGLNGDQLRWDIGLSPKVPLELIVDASSGDATLNLQELKLRKLLVNTSSGNFTANLPAGSERYTVSVDASSGNLDFYLPAGAAMDGSVSMSSGNVTFHIPADAGVQLNVRESSSGNVRVPASFTRTADNGRNRGTWESPNFSTAEHKIVLTVPSMSSGNFEVR